MGLVNHLLAQLEKLEPSELYIILQKCEEKLVDAGMVMTQRPKGTKAHPHAAKPNKKMRYQVRIRYRYFRCGKTNCSVCTGGGKHGPYGVKVTTDTKTGKKQEIYLGKGAAGKRNGG